MLGGGLAERGFIGSSAKPLSPMGIQAQLRPARPTAVWGTAGAAGPPALGAAGDQEISPQGSGQHRLRLPAQIPAANRLLPPLRSDGRDCAAGDREGGSSVPPRNTRKTLPQLKFSKAIRSNTAAYSLNTRYFCNPCSASAPPPDGKAPQRRGGRRHGPPRFRARAAPEPRRSPRGTPGTRVRTPGPAGRPGQQEAAALLPALPGDGAVTPRELLLSAGQGWGRRRAGGAAPVPPAPQRREG